MDFRRGDYVKKVSGDYTIYGRIVDVVVKYTRDLELWDPTEVRFLVQDDRGMLLILHGRQLSHWDKASDNNDTNEKIVGGK